MKIYTKTGDCGTTGLFAGPRVDKDHPRIEAYGSVDELNSAMGVVIAQLQTTPTSANGSSGQDLPDADEISGWLGEVQHDLFAMGAELATPEPAKHGMCLLTPDRTTALEQWIDRLEEGLPALENFILPGGSLAAAQTQLARTICRRAERQVVHLSHQPEVQDCSGLIIYLNRLSDLLFVLSRAINAMAGQPEPVWQARVAGQ